jgi:hypothetical protein
MPLVETLAGVAEPDTGCGTLPATAVPSFDFVDLLFVEWPMKNAAANAAAPRRAAIRRIRTGLLIPAARL